MEKRELRLAIPSKGRLFDDSAALLKKAGVSYRRESRVDISPAVIPEGEFELGFLRPEDIIRSVAEDDVDLGIVGQDKLAELGVPLQTLSELGFGKCRLMVAVPDSYSSDFGLSDLREKKVATSFPNITDRFLNQRMNLNVSLKIMAGGVETASRWFGADAIVDITETGTSLMANKLRELSCFMESQAVLVTSPLYQEKRSGFDRADNFDAVFSALKRRLITACTKTSERELVYA